jgi:hypothetical protein
MGKSKHKPNGSSKLIKNVKVVHSAPANASSDKIKKRVHPSTKALMEIKKYQKSTNLVIPKQSFDHVLSWIVQVLGLKDLLSNVFKSVLKGTSRRNLKTSICAAFIAKEG